MKKMSKDQEHIMHTVKSAFKDEVLPPLEFSQVGRVRLINALAKKYGVQFRNIPEAKAAIDAFDGEMDFTTQLRAIKEGRRF